MSVIYFVRDLAAACIICVHNSKVSARQELTVHNVTFQTCWELAYMYFLPHALNMSKTTFFIVISNCNIPKYLNSQRTFSRRHWLWLCEILIYFYIQNKCYLIFFF